MFNKVKVDKQEYNSMMSVLEPVSTALLDPLNNALIIKMMFGDIDAEAGIVVGTANPNYAEIRQLALKGMEE